MNRALRHIFVFAVLVLAGCWQAMGQMYPERKHIRLGNKDYEALEYGASEGDYRKALAKNPVSFEAGFNLGDALYKQERFEEAENTFNALLQSPVLSGEQLGAIHHNIGNAQFGQRKLKEAEQSYMNSLMFNPSDLETKYNLAYVQKLLENEEGGGGGNDPDQNQDQDQNQNQDQNGDQNQDKQDKNDQNQDQNQQDKPEPQPREGAMNRADAEKMLEAMQQQEDKTRDKVNEKQAATTAKSGKNW